ncbi:MAG: PRTRC system protein C [Dehalococcoidia bacterium]
MPREFIYDGRTFPDPDPAMAVDDVRRMLADFLPELATAETLQNQQGDTTVIEFKKRVGTKG